MSSTGLRAVAGSGRDDRPPPEPGDRTEGFRSGASWFAPLTAVDGYWLELTDAGKAEAERVEPLLSQLLGAEKDTLKLAQQLADRYEEIELLYTISETLGRTIGLSEAARTIVREVSTVVGARRASILVHDPDRNVLLPVAGWGIDVAQFDPIPVDDPCSIAARVFRERRIIDYDPLGPEEPPPCEPGRTYRGAAFVCVPIVYPQPGDEPRPVGVLNVTDRSGTDAFPESDKRLLAAIANQVGATIENARLVERDRRRERVSRELELAHDLQEKLLRSRVVSGADVAGRCQPVESVGGDFYHVLRLPENRLGVMLGDVSSHGYSAALIMALVLSAAGIHAEKAASPADALELLLESVCDELSATEMYLTLFYGVADPAAGVLRYANAGHPHAFRITASGEAMRLAATSPPLGLAPEGELTGEEAEWNAGEDALVLFSDGIADAVNEAGERFGEERVLALTQAERWKGAEAAVVAVFDALAAFGPGQRDDQTILVLNA